MWGGSGVIEYGDDPWGSSTRTLLDRATGHALSMLRSNVERSDQSGETFSRQPRRTRRENNTAIVGQKQSQAVGEQLRHEY